MQSGSNNNVEKFTKRYKIVDEWDPAPKRKHRRHNCPACGTKMRLNRYELECPKCGESIPLPARA